MTESAKIAILVQALRDVLVPMNYLRRKGETNLNRLLNAEMSVNLREDIAAEALVATGYTEEIPDDSQA